LAVKVSGDVVNVNVLKKTGFKKEHRGFSTGFKKRTNAGLVGGLPSYAVFPATPTTDDHTGQPRMFTTTKPKKETGFKAGNGDGMYYSGTVSARVT